MIYTTYLSRIDKIPKGRRIIIVMRYLPNEYECRVESGELEWMPELSPTPDMFNSKTRDWNDLTNDILASYYESVSLYQSIYESSLLDDVFLVCCEVNDLACHRSILRSIFSSVYGVPCKEWQINGRCNYAR